MNEFKTLSLIHSFACMHSSYMIYARIRLRQSGGCLWSWWLFYESDCYETMTHTNTSLVRECLPAKRRARLFTFKGQSNSYGIVPTTTKLSSATIPLLPWLLLEGSGVALILTEANFKNELSVSNGAILLQMLEEPPPALFDITYDILLTSPVVVV